MKIKFTREKLAENPVTFIRHCGYGEYYDRRAHKVSYMKRARMTDMFPRYHVYIEENTDGVTFDLHLDQKRPSYEGSSMHSGEYTGSAVEREAKRILELAQRPKE